MRHQPKLALLLGVCVFALHTNAFAAEPEFHILRTDDPRLATQDQDRRAPIDYGYGVGVSRPGTGFWHRVFGRMGWPGISRDAGTTRGASVRATAAAPATAKSVAPAAQRLLVVANGGSIAAVTGVFAPAISWPIVPIHAALLPDGRVMSYGTDQSGSQNGQLIYDVWDPSLGTDSNSHLVLPNTTTTDLFCSAQSLLANGSLLVTGGDLTINGKRNYSNNNVNIFTPAANALTSASPMQYARWYAALVPLPNGDHLVVGGRSAPYVSVNVPELYSTTTGWRTLSKSNNYGIAEWYYPKAFVGPDGTIFMLNTDGRIFKIGTSGLGTFASMGNFAAAGLYDLPTLMFAPGKLLSIRRGGVVDVVDFNGVTPVVTPVDSLPGGREWANATLLADGRVFVNGGSGAANVLTNVSYQAYIFDPATLKWTPAATAAKPRLYHSNALLLPDGSVLTGGGGAPGPVNNLNAEIYDPPYLFANDGSGNAAARVAIVAATPVVAAGQAVTLTMADGTPISRVTLLRVGAATHATNLEQRFFDLGFAQSDNLVTATAPANTNLLLPGYYMVFAFDTNGVPSVAQFVQVQLAAGASLAPK